MTATCPVCYADIFAKVVAGPNTATVTPCGHDVPPDAVDAGLDEERAPIARTR